MQILLAVIFLVIIAIAVISTIIITIPYPIVWIITGRDSSYCTYPFYLLECVAESKIFKKYTYYDHC